ncbi:Glutamate-ammonia-ligase adenylyltransferase [Methylacidimicrobium cyclopophantes]|uniref:Glutamate-ammonia-ligase adenylyltransferase n=1 Tax=Methylacidimicrobium cyclopophantes TaxID=1041766 RepID=A0A5E6MCD8_9BACT|nr:glutamine-synthetase adenylyltransferase [Methylacidimicrobium cyclopophantes]VVM05950.1 Glutamate-ammonia-ligase adenylyltransferase [Methylacidimicrobium cyclopophantes]
MEKFGRFATFEAALAAFQKFSLVSRGRLVAHPDWVDWLTAVVASPECATRGPGRWSMDWRELWGVHADGEKKLNALRLLKQREQIRIGLLDFAGLWSWEKTTGALSRLADFCVGQVLQVVCEESRVNQTPLAILALGKLGGGELNYSSDIDIVFLAADDENPFAGSLRPMIARQVVAGLADSKGVGSLYRVDLRLRPDGNAGALVPSFSECERYYASSGETWERMALIKARFVAGDAGLGYEFEVLRHQFCFPRHLSEEVFEEIAAMKSRIDEEILSADRKERDVKLGPGGIREIEFLAQALQLFYGARQPVIQVRSTCGALRALSTVGLLPQDQVDALIDAYGFLRNLEHRLQMVEELQTHLLPTEAAARSRIAESLGFSTSEFESKLRSHRSYVHELFQQYFTKKESPSVSIPLELFASPEEAVRNLEALQQRDSLLSAPRATRAYRRLTPFLGKALHLAVEPDVVLRRFVSFVARYGARSYLFETLAANPKALELLVRLFDASSFFSEILFAQPELFEEITQSRSLGCRKGKEEYLEGLGCVRGEAAVGARLYRRGELLRILLRDILGLADLLEIQREYTALAEACLEFACQTIPSGDLAYIGLGRFGGGELAYGSDLDCLCVGSQEQSALAIHRFLGEPLPAGILFPMDYRLRPHGEGPLALPVEVYEVYYRDKAQFWEIQALTRARFVAGEGKTGERFIAMVDRLWRERSRACPLDEIISMRERIEQERHAALAPFQRFKTGAGGILDIEFGLTLWSMRTGKREPNFWNVLADLRTREPDLAGVLEDGYRFLRRVEAVLRRERNQQQEVLPEDPTAWKKLGQRLGFPTVEEFIGAYEGKRKGIRAAYRELCERVRRLPR